MYLAKKVTIAAFLISCLIAPALALGSPIHLGFTIDIPMMTQRESWRDVGVRRMEHEIREEMITLLEATFDFWTFLSSESQSGPRCEITFLSKGNEALLEMTCRMPRQKKSPLNVSTIVWQPDEFGVKVFSEPEIAKEEIVQALRAMVLEARDKYLATERWLMTWVPIGVDGTTWLPEVANQPPRILLPVEEELRQSRFRLTCLTDEGTAELDATGTGRIRIRSQESQPVAPQDTPARASLEAIPSHLHYASQIFEVKDFQVGGFSLRDLHPQSIFLREYVPPRTSPLIIAEER